MIGSAGHFGERHRQQLANEDYIGVTWSRNENTWLVHIWHNENLLFIGKYANKAEAAIAYDDVAQLIMSTNSNINYRLNFGAFNDAQTQRNRNAALSLHPVFPRIHAKVIKEDVAERVIPPPPPIFSEAVHHEPLDAPSVFFSSRYSSPSWDTLAFPSTPSLSLQRTLTSEQLDEIEKGPIFDCRPRE